MKNKLPDLSDIIKAQKLLKGIVKTTPLEPSKSFSAMADTSVYLKLENLQSTGSFKVRGAYNKIFHLSEDEKKRGVICSSAGNHAQGVAYAAKKLGIDATVFMPIFTSPLKVIATRSYGAKVILEGESFDDAYKAALDYQEITNTVFVHAFNDPYIIAGQGTIGLEIFHQLDCLQDVVVPIGGGGLIAGIAIALKELNPDIRIIGVEAEGAASMKTSIEQEGIRTITNMQTIADGIAVKTPGDLNFQIARKFVDHFVTVSDSEIAHATYLLLQRAKILGEPAGVAAMAAILYKKFDFSGRCVVPIISGGNINMGVLDQILEKGMMQEGLRARIAVLIPDKAGELKTIIAILTELRASIHDITHERSITSVPVGFVLVSITFNLQDTGQLETIKKSLDEKNLSYEILR